MVTLCFVGHLQNWFLIKYYIVGSENNSENKDDASLADDDGQCLANQYLPLEQSLKIRDENRTENKEDKVLAP